MIRIEQLNNGALHITSALGPSSFVAEEDMHKLPDEIRDKLAILRATDVGTRIEDVGLHAAPRRFWIFNDIDDDTLFSMLMLAIPWNPPFTHVTEPVLWRMVENILRETKGQSK